MTVPAFYTRDGNRFVPTGLGVSPWNDQAQMGVALAGLVVHELDAAPSLVPMLTARLTIDILGPVPIAPLTSAVRILREGRRVQLVEAELQIDGRAWVRASALRLRISESPATSVPLTRPFPGKPAAKEPLPWVETLRVEGDYQIAGPGASWVRITSPVIASEPRAPLEALAMVADFGSGTAPLVPLKEWTFANVDISIHLTRLPCGEWLLLDAVSESAGNGVGVTHSRIGDREGMIGMAHQTTFLERR